jgi:DNA replication and checkpoint protein
VRPVPQLEIAPSDDEVDEPQSPTIQKARSQKLSRTSPELGDENLDHSQFQDEEEPSDLDEARAEAEKAEKPASTKGNKPKVQATRKAKGGYKIGKQVSGNFVSYKIRSKGQRGRGRFGGGRFGRR